jgi:hypothetical protein
MGSVCLVFITKHSGIDNYGTVVEWLYTPL